MRNASLDLVIITIVLAIAYIRPTMMVNFFNTNVGRFSLLAGIVALSSIDTLWGLLGVLVLICFRESITIEGMEGMNSTNSNNTASASTTDVPTTNKTTTTSNKNVKPTEVKPDEWRKKNCKANKVMLNDKAVDMKDFSKNFPNVKFTDGDCNPCMDTCKIKVTSAAARLEAEEGVRSKPSNSIPVQPDTKN